MKNLMHTARRALATAVVASLLPWAGGASAAPAATPLQSRSVTPLERYELTRQVFTRFGQAEPVEMQVSAAGPFRFVNAPAFLYLDRSDLGSVGFENPQYGVGTAALDAAAVERGSVLDKVELALQRAGLAADGRVFDSFNDEYEGAGQPDAMRAGFDPRRSSRHVARTAVFTREIGGLPVFGSELVVGLMPDGSIGRFRLHWPAIAPALVDEASVLQQAVQARRWALPQAAQADGLQVLETRVGIAHTGFADPGYAVHAVVRVLVRRASPTGEKLALSSTGYVYYDADGRELQLGGAPATPGTAAELKGDRTR